MKIRMWTSWEWKAVGIIQPATHILSQSHTNTMELKLIFFLFYNQGNRLKKIE